MNSKAINIIKARVLYGEFDDACVPWTGDVDDTGRGRVYYRGNYNIVPRIALQFELRRPLRPDEHVLHSCDNPNCWNPKHLRVGTRSENMQEMYGKGRHTIQSKSIGTNT